MLQTDIVPPTQVVLRSVDILKALRPCLFANRCIFYFGELKTPRY